MKQVKVDDYFSTNDMRAEGPDRWNALRDEVRRQGHQVSHRYGGFGVSVTPDQFVYLHRDGDLVHTFHPRNGRRLTISQVIGASKPEEKEVLKIRVNGDPVKTKLAFEHLVSLGYDGRHSDTVMSYHNPSGMVGLIANAERDLTIYMITSEKTFSERYEGVAEVTFDVETTHSMTNIQLKKKIVEVCGFKVEEEALLAFLKSASTAA